jgi:hypothetical protein
MSIDRTLTPILARIYADNPSITTDRAAQLIQAEIANLQPDQARAYIRELSHEGIKQRCRQFCRHERGKALRLLRSAVLVPLTDRESLTGYLQTKLPLPDSDFAPTVGEATALHLLRAAGYLRQMEATTGEQAARYELLAARLSKAAERAGNPALTVNDATARGLLNWALIAA